MFTIPKPIKHTRLKSMEELFKFSYQIDFSSEEKFVVNQNDNLIAFITEDGNKYVTPYRPESESILTEAGYSIDSSLFVPIIRPGQGTPEFQWLVKIAKEENLAYTYEQAFAISQEKGIKPLEKVHGKYQIKEISFDTTSSNYLPLAHMFLTKSSKDNIGTYIIIDEKTLIMCDDYGRTFLIKAKIVINNLVNALIDAGYTRTVHPEKYINKLEPNSEE